MKELITRLENEYNELLARIERLDAFLEKPEEAAGKAGAVQVYLLRIQLSAMELYLHTLEARIEDLRRNAATRQKKKDKEQKETDKPKEKREEERPADTPDIIQVAVDTFNRLFGEDFKVKLWRSGHFAG